MVGDYYSSPDYAGIFTAQTRSDEHEFSGQHGACTESCGYVFERMVASISDVDARFCARNCLTISGCVDASFCPDLFQDTSVTHVDHYYSPCSIESGNCPLGWGTRSNYYAFKPGCFDGKHYPSPTPPYIGLSPFQGS